MSLYCFCWETTGPSGGPSTYCGQPGANRSLVEDFVEQHERSYGAGTAWIEEIPDDFITTFLVLGNDGNLWVEASASSILNFAETRGLSFHQCVRMMEPYFSWNEHPQEGPRIDQKQFVEICDRCTGQALGDHAALIVLKDALGYTAKDIDAFLRSFLSSSYEDRMTQLFLCVAENILGYKLGELGAK